MPRVFPHARRRIGGIRGPLAWVLGAVLIACSPSEDPDGERSRREARPTPVAVVRVAQEAFEGAFLEREATLYPVSQVVVSTRQEGFVRRRHVEDGDVLHKGDPIADLDDTEHRLQLVELRAALRRARATLDDAQRAMKRAEQLSEKNVISSGELDDRRNALARAQADVAEARARVERAVEALTEFKVTAPMTLVRNRKARPDKWERDKLRNNLMNPNWPKGKLFSERAKNSGRKAFRMLVPEYFGAGCLACHGGPKGEIDITGYPKEGAHEGELAGAISITLFGS